MTGGRLAMMKMTLYVALWAAVELLAAGVLSRYSGFQVVWARYLFHLLLMAAFLGWRAPTTLWRTDRPIYQLTRSMLMVGMPASWVLGMHVHLDPNTLMSVFWLSPLIVLGLAALLLKETPVPAIWAACATAAIGTFLLHPPGGLASPWLLLFPLGMAVSFSLYVVMTRPLRVESASANLFYSALGVFVVLTPLMPRVWLWPDLHDWLILAGVGALGLAALWALDRAVAAAPVTLTAPILYLQIPFMLVASLHLAPIAWDWRTRLGLLIVVASAVCVFALEPMLAARSAARPACLFGRPEGTGAGRVK